MSKSTALSIAAGFVLLSELRAAFVKQVHESRRPMVLTRRGRAVAVLMDAGELERMQARLAILEDIYRAEEQLAAGEGLDHEAAEARVLKGLVRRSREICKPVF